MEEASTTFWGNPVNISGPHSPPMYMLIQSLLYFHTGGSGAAPFWEEGMGLLIAAGQILVF